MEACSCRLICFNQGLTICVSGSGRAGGGGGGLFFFQQLKLDFF